MQNLFSISNCLSIFKKICFSREAIYSFNHHSLFLFFFFSPLNPFIYGTISLLVFRGKSFLFFSFWFERRGSHLAEHSTISLSLSLFLTLYPPESHPPTNAHLGPNYIGWLPLPLKALRQSTQGPGLRVCHPWAHLIKAGLLTPAA